VQGWGYLNDGDRPYSFQETPTLEKGRFELSVPALRMDLRFASEGFSPSYLWDVAVQGKETADLGQILLKTGSSLCGFITDESSGSPVGSAEVLLSVPRPQAGSKTTAVERLSRLTWTTRTNQRGFYQIVGVPHGNYRLQVTSPNPEQQLLVMDPVGILADAETCLEDLTMRRTIEVSFAISPAQGPHGEPWLARLNPSGQGGFVEPREAVPLDEMGWAKFHVAPGPFDLIVFSDGDNKGAALRLQVLDRTVKLDYPQHIPLSLEVIRLEGSIRIGEEPLVAQIDLWSGEGGNTKLESDVEGLFSGWIRAPGEKGMVAEVSAAYPPFSRWLQIEEPTIEDGVLRLDLSFENRALEGTVTDEKGTPIRRAEVTATPLETRMSIKATTEVDGSFRLVGLADKPYKVTARLRDFGVSDTFRVEPWGESTGPDLTLVLRPGRRVRGRLTSAELDGVAGAKVSFSVPGGSAAIPSDSTDIEGRFEVRVPEWADRAVATVLVASHVLWTACVDLPHEDGADLSLRLPPLPGGRLLIRAPQGEWSDPKGSLALLSAEGGFFYSVHLANWLSHAFGRGAFQQGSPESPEGYSTLAVPNLAAGLYAAVWVSGSADFAALTCAGGFSSAEWQYLAPGGEVLLTLSTNAPGSSGIGSE
jgi:hypothetical protein